MFFFIVFVKKKEFNFLKLLLLLLFMVSTCIVIEQICFRNYDKKFSKLESYN